MPERVKVLYIAGWGRSGSTVLDNLLGELDGYFSGGELHYFWERGLIEGRKCGCGRLITSCEVWSRVLERVASSTALSQVDPHQIVQWQTETVRVRHTQRLLRTSPADVADSIPLRSYAEVLGGLYGAIADAGEARVIVDSSKRPSDGAFLRLLPNVVPYYIHLVRDPRAVAYSWRRRKRQLDRDRPAELRRHGVADSTASWLGWNLEIESLRRHVPAQHSLLVRYEDFVRRPRSVVAGVVNMVGEDTGALPFEDDSTVRLSGNHTTSGNPSRFTTGAVKLRGDDEWLMHQPTWDRLQATAIAAPLLRRYGYPLRLGARPRSHGAPTDRSASEDGRTG